MTLEEFKSKYTAHWPDVEADFKSAVHPLWAEIFAKYPDVIRIQWNQYTPNFNDGEPCVFGVGQGPLAVTGELDKKVDRWEPPHNEEASRELDAIFGKKFPEETLEVIYGNGVTVMIARDLTATTTDYWDHD